VIEARIDDESFSRLSRLVERTAGIHLPPPKRALVEARLGRRLRALGLRSFVEYCRFAQTSEPELVHLLDAICTNETRFFREPSHFQLLRERLIPRWRADALAGRRDRAVRAWSAACSTGEEPCSLAIALTDELPGWEIDVLATDLSSRALSQAKRGEFALERAAQIPEPYLKRYMQRGTGERAGRMRAVPSVMERIRFARHNLHEPAWLPSAHDLIFCCNVLIYFDRETRREVVRRLLGQLAPDGVLVLGSAELIDPGLPARKIAPNAYELASSRSW
jgi:chemotaxis protein methyltransferase CheR